MRWAMAVAAGLVGVTAAAMPASADEKCISRSYAFESFDNASVDVQMTARTGALCGIVLGETGGYVHSTGIARAPAHGAAMARGLYVVYRSAPKYHGPDRLTYVRDVTLQTGDRVRRTVNVLVTVVP